MFSGGVAAGWLRKAASAPSGIDATIGGSWHSTVAQGGCTAPGQFRGTPGLWHQRVLQSVLQDACGRNKRGTVCMGARNFLGLGMQQPLESL